MSNWSDTTRAGEALLEATAVPEASTRQSLLLLGAAAAAVLAALLLFGGFLANILGYLTASVGVFTLVAFFRRALVRRSAGLGFTPPRHLNLIALGLTAVGFLLSVVHAWLIATNLS